MTDGTKVQLGVEFDATGAQAGFDQVKQGARDMAASVEAAGTKASGAIDGMGNGGKGAADKVDKATRSMIGSIERATAALQAGERGTASYFETLAKQRGVGAEALQPYIQQLRAAEAAQASAAASMGKLGLSAGQLRQATLQLPMQFQDIVVSLQSGQAPMTVMLQQGSQLAGSFGGIANAAKAMGAYVIGLINPFTLLAGAVAAVGIAYYQGSKEADAYNRALILSGNVSGTTAGQLQDMARALADGTRTQRESAAALAEMAQSSQVGGQYLQEYTRIALDWQRATGTAVGETAKAFKDLQNDPLQASLKLNEGLHHLTLGTYEHIRSLTEQGKTVEAARVAQEAYAQSLAQRSGQMEQNLGAIERGWRAVANAAKSAWDTMLNVGRSTSAADQLQALRTQLDQRMQRGPLNSAPGMQEAWAKGNEELKKQIGYLGEQERMLRRGAEATAAAAQQVQAKTEWDKQGSKYLSDNAKLERDLAQARAQGAAAGLKQSEIEERLSAIRASYAKKGGGSASSLASGENEVARIKAMIADEQAYTKALQERGEAATKLTAGEKLVAQIQQQLQTGLKGVARSNKEAALAEAERLVVAEKARAAAEKQVKALADDRATLDQSVDAAQKLATSLGQQAAELDASNQQWGKGKLAIEQYRLQQAQEMLAMAEASDSFAPAYVKALRDIVDARKALVSGTADAQFKTFSEQIHTWAASAQAAASLYQDEAQMVGLTAVERAKIVAARQVELKLAQEIDKINKSGLDDARKQELINAATAAAATEKSAAVAKVVQDDWAKTADSINQSLTDALLRGFESGKGFAENFRTTLKNMFSTLVLKPIISFIVQPIGNAISAVVNGVLGTGGTGSGSGLLGTASNVSSAYSLFSGTGGSTNAISSLFGGSMSFGNAAGSVYANTFSSLYGGDGISALLSTNGAYGTAGAGWGSAATGLGVVAMPLIVGALIEKYGKHNWERFTGAATSANTAAPTVTSGSTSYDMLTGNLPDRSALISQLTGLGANESDLSGLNTRQLYKLLTNANTEVGLQRETGPRLDWSTWIKDNANLPDFYQGQGYANPQALGWWANDNFYGSYGGAAGYNALGVDPQIVQAMRTLATGVADPINAISKALGGTGGYTATAGLASDADKGFWAGLNVRGADGTSLVDFGRREGAGITGTTYKTQDEAMQALFKSALQGLEQLDLPGWAKKQVEDTTAQFDTLTGDNIGQQAADLYSKASAGIASTITAIQQLIDVVPMFATSTQDVVYNIAQASGGMDTFSSRLSSYYQNFYSESERQAIAMGQMTEQFKDLGVEVPKSRADYRKLVEATIAAGDGSEELAAKLLALGDTVATVYKQIEVTFGQSQQLTDTLTSGLLGTFDGTNIGATMAQIVTDGIYGALAGGFAAQITDIIVSGVVNPVIQAAITGSSVSAAVSDAAINDMVAKAQAVASAATALFNDPAFQSAIQQIGNAVASINVPTLNLASSYHAAAAATTSYTSAVDAGATAAAAAADKIQSAWQDIADSLIDQVKKIRGELADSQQDSLAYWHSQFAIATASARAGNQDAAQSLIGLSDSLLTAAAAQATSQLQLAQIRAATAQSLQDTAGYATAYAGGAAVSTSSASLTALTAGAASQPVVVAADPDLLAELRDLKAQQQQLSARVESKLSQIFDLEKRWDVVGVPTRQV